MNKDINLCQILKGLEGIELYSTIYGKCILRDILPSQRYNENGPYYTIKLDACDIKNRKIFSVDEKGLYNQNFNGECTLFPSETQRDWSKFVRPYSKDSPMMCSSDGKKMNNNIDFVEILLSILRIAVAVEIIGFIAFYLYVILYMIITI